MITTIVATAVGIYEVLSRVVKTTKTWSLIGNILKVLTYISDLFDNKTKSK